MTADGTVTAQQAGHELLIRQAGRLPDELLWRLRDWLAADDRTAFLSMLPRELLRHQVGLTDGERALLVAAVGENDASRRLPDAVLPLPSSDNTTAVFHTGQDPLDQAALSVLAVVRGHPGCVELRQAWRLGGRQDQRVVIVHGGDRPWALTSTLQRILRAHGDRTPCVEVLQPYGETPAYHQAAIIGSAPMWRSAAMAEK